MTWLEMIVVLLVWTEVLTLKLDAVAWVSFNR
jgi:hypothetical protein